MKLGYIIQKILKKMFNRPCINQSNIEKSARIDIGSVVVETSMDRYSYIGEHTSVLCAEIGAFTCISNYCAIGGGSHPIDWVSVSPVFNTTKGIIKKKLSSLQYSPFQKVHIGNDVWIGSHVLIKSGVTISDGAVIGMVCGFYRIGGNCCINSGSLKCVKFQWIVFHRLLKNRLSNRRM